MTMTKIIVHETDRSEIIEACGSKGSQFLPATSQHMRLTDGKIFIVSPNGADYVVTVPGNSEQVAMIRNWIKCHGLPKPKIEIGGDK